MVIYILKKIVTCLMILFLLAQLSFCLAYFAPNSLLSHFSLFDAYLTFFKQLFSGQFLFLSGKTVPFLHAFSATFELCLLALLVSILIGIPIGIFVGITRFNSISNIIQIVSLMLYSCPIVWIFTLLIFFLSPHLSELINAKIPLPDNGISLMDILTATQPNKFKLLTEQLKFLTLPMIILAIQPSIITIQLVSHNVRKVIKQNYIKMASIRETSSFKILRRHLLPNAIPTTIPKLAYNATTLLFSAMIVEILLDIDGLGKWVMLAYQQHNYNIIAISILTCGAFISLLVLLSELLTVIIYPMQLKENYA